MKALYRNLFSTVRAQPSTPHYCTATISRCGPQTLSHAMPLAAVTMGNARQRSRLALGKVQSVRSRVRTMSSTAGTNAKGVCWKCQRLREENAQLFCTNPACDAIQPVDKNATYFDALLDGSKPTFDVDLGQLRKNFLKLQQGVHPDSFSQKEDIERKLAESQSSWINHGYSTLKSPLLRAHYLLELQGLEVRESDNVSDPEILMEVMELREEIESAQTEEQVERIKKSNDEKMHSIVNELSIAFSHDNFDRAKDLTNHLQYLTRVSQAVNNWEPGKRVVVSH